MLKLVGDNPFHGVSHLSQQRALDRGNKIIKPEYAANLVKLAIENGADGFMFSVTDTTLAILRILHTKYGLKGLKLFAIVPAGAEIARLMGPSGGIEGTVKSIAKRMLLSGNLPAVYSALKGVSTLNWEDVVSSYVNYEAYRIKKAANNQSADSLMLHEIVTDMALSLDIKEFFHAYCNLVRKCGSDPGFETRNFAFLVRKFQEWGIDLDQIPIAAPFNKIGFQMSPSRIECEQAIGLIQHPKVIAISVLAAGYLKPLESLEYINNLNLAGVAVAVSNETQARETFRLLG